MCQPSRPGDTFIHVWILGVGVVPTAAAAISCVRVSAFSDSMIPNI